jgi:NAD-dependent DNA ligase
MRFLLNDALRQNAPTAAVHAKKRRDRDTNELIGVCRGVLADGVVDATEARFLLDWLERRSDLRNVFPFDILLERLADALRDGVLDEAEEVDLLQSIVSLVGGEHASDSASLATSLPLDNPQPRVEHAGASFVVTGTFAFGPRVSVVRAIEDRGGRLMAAVSPRTSYVVVGEVGSRDWVHSSFGRKIQAAADLRSEGHQIRLISERRWCEFL